MKNIFKKTLLILIVLMFISPMTYACEEGQSCTLKKNSKVMQFIPEKYFKPIIVPEDIIITVGPKIPLAMVKEIDNMKVNKDKGITFTGGYIGGVEINFGRGPSMITFVFKIGDVKNCIKNGI